MARQDNRRTVSLQRRRASLRACLAHTAVIIGFLLFPVQTFAQEQVLRIAVLNDQSGPLSADSGAGSTAAAQLAIDEVNGRAGPFKLGVIGLDHQNKPDVGVTLAKQAFDTQDVSAIFDFSNSAVSLAVQSLATAENKIVVHVGSAVTSLFGAQCSPLSAVWLQDFDEVGRAVLQSDVDAAKSSWFMLGSDYTAGKAGLELQRRLVSEAGGKTVGSVLTPLDQADYSAAILTAQSSGAKVLYMNYAGTALSAAVKQASEFGLIGPMQVKLGFLTDNAALAIGPETSHGLQTVTGYYWNRDEASRAFAVRYAKVMQGRMPSQVQAGVYSAVRHYFRAVEATGTKEGPTVMAKMKELPVDDFFGEGARIRADGRLMKDTFAVEVKDLKTMTGPLDIFKVRERLSAAAVIAPMTGACPYVK